MKISCFRAKAHLVFHWCLYNNNNNNNNNNDNNIIIIIIIIIINYVIIISGIIIPLTFYMQAVNTNLSSTRCLLSVLVNF